MVNWSYRLLTDDERLVLNRSSVFAGGFDLRALDEVCLDGAGGPTDTAAADRIESLVAKSMVVAMPDGDGTRYMLLETIRQFAHERLHETGEVSTTRDRHLAHFVATADHFDEISNGPRQVEGYEHFRREWGNLRAAFGWALAARNVGDCMAVLRSCSLFAHCAVAAEFGEWAERLVALDTAERPLPAEAFGFAAEWAQTRADDDLAYEQFSAGVSRASRPDHPGTARCWWVGTFRNPGRVSTSAALDNYRNLRQAVANTPDIERQWLALVDLVDATFRLDHAAFQSDLQRLSALSERLASPSLQIYTALYRGHGRLAEVPTNFEDARADYSEALQLAESVGDLRGAGMAQRGLVIVSVGVGADDALSRCHDTISSLYDNRFWQKLWQVLDSTAAALLTDADIESAAVIVGTRSIRW